MFKMPGLLLQIYEDHILCFIHYHKSFVQSVRSFIKNNNNF